VSATRGGQARTVDGVHRNVTLGPVTVADNLSVKQFDFTFGIKIFSLKVLKFLKVLC
jgi:hypothetical protein